MGKTLKSERLEEISCFNVHTKEHDFHLKDKIVDLKKELAKVPVVVQETKEAQKPFIAIVKANTMCNSSMVSLLP